jgi:hypothetical protein
MMDERQIASGIAAPQCGNYEDALVAAKSKVWPCLRMLLWGKALTVREFGHLLPLHLWEGVGGWGFKS